MKQRLRWVDYLIINVFFLGGSTATGLITPVLLPYLVAAFVPPDRKNTYLAIIRVSSLAVAMMIQPMAGLLSDRSTHRWGRRRPYIAAGSTLALIFLLLVGASPEFVDSPLNRVTEPLFAVSTAYIVLLIGIILWQAAANVAQAAQQGLIPDLVPALYLGRAGGVKALMELSASVPVTLIGPLVDRDQIWMTVTLIIGVVLVPFLITMIGVREQPLEEKPAGRVRWEMARYAGLAAVFVIVTLLAGLGVWALGMVLVEGSGGAGGRADWGKLVATGFAGLGATVVAIVLGVYGGATVGLGREAGDQKIDRASFIWWVIYRLSFLVAAGSIQQFTFYYMSDVQGVPNPAGMTARLAATMAGFLLVSAVVSGSLSDRWGRIPLLTLASGLSAASTVVLILAPSLTLVFITSCFFGLAVGAFMATSWALGTDLVPPSQGGRYLGIANLAGGGAGIVAVGIGGPLADLVNALHTGLGYLVIFGIDGGLFGLSILALRRIREPARGHPTEDRDPDCGRMAVGLGDRARVAFRRPR